jgi:hypothetical protein
MSAAVSNYAGPLTGILADASKPVRRRNFFPRTYSHLIDRRMRRDAGRDAIVTEREMRHEVDKRSNIMAGAARQTVAPAWSAATRPTHFVALRVPTQSALQHGIGAMHADIESTMALVPWKRCLVPLDRLSLTLAVCSCPDDAAVERARAVTRDFFQGGMLLRPYGSEVAAKRSLFHDSTQVTSSTGKAYTSMRASSATSPRNALYAQYDAQGRFAPLTIRFNGLGTFDDGRVVFARASADHDFQRLAAAVRSLRRALYDAGADIKGNPDDEFTPYVTVAKVGDKARAVLEEEARRERLRAAQATGTTEESVLRSLIRTSLGPRKIAAVPAEDTPATTLLNIRNVSPLPAVQRDFGRVPDLLYRHAMWDDFGLATFTQGAMLPMQWASLSGNWTLPQDEIPAAAADPAAVVDAPL